MLKRLTVLVAAVLALALHAAPLPAQTLQSLKPDFSADLVAGGVDRSDANVAWVGVRVRLGPGWHTYWRSPGDAGAPPEFDWRGSQNVAGAMSNIRHRTASPRPASTPSVMNTRSYFPSACACAIQRRRR